MEKTLTFDYQGNTYTLEFTRKSVQQMERNGFIITELGDKPMTFLPTLFEGAFIAHHKFLKKQIIDEIYSKLTDKGALFDTLLEMYQYPIETLMNDEPDEGNAIAWKKDF